MLLCQVMVRQLQQLQIKSIKAPKYRAKKHQLCVSDAAWLHHEMVYRSSCWVGPLENNMSNLILTSIDILAIHLDCWWWALSFCHISRSSPTNDQEIERLLPYTGFGTCWCQSTNAKAQVKGSRPTDVDVHQATLRQWNDRSILRIFPYYPTKVHGCKWINMRKHDWEKTWERCAQVKYHDSPVIGFEINLLEMRKAKVLLLFGCFKSGIAWNSGSNWEDVIMCRVV